MNQQLEISTRGVAFTGASLVDMLRHRARHQPRDIAYTFLDDGERPGACWSWSEVDRRARAIAVALGHSVAAGSRALLMFPPGLDFVAAFFGCLYARVIAVPVTPPHRGLAQRGRDRIGAVTAAATPSIVLSAGDRSGDARLRLPAVELPWLDCGAVDDSCADEWEAPSIDEDALAFLQFTSGSTATPRGVMVSHANLLHNLAYGFEAGETNEETVSVSWLPVTHDMGLIEGVLQPAFAGCPVYLMSPSAFLQRPMRWLAALSAYGATRSGGPNFAYDLAVSRVWPADRAALDLSRWTAAYNGAEPVRADTLAAFATTYAPYGFRRSALRPCYGLAEHTLVVATDRWPDATTGDGPVSCGAPAHGTTVVIVNPATGVRVADGELGEIRVAGPSVAGGYWNDADETNRVFVTSPECDSRWLCTGDLGYLRDGRLYVCGRIKDLLIVRGAKLFPQDVEQTVESVHPSIRRGCVTAVAIASGVRGDHVVVIAEVDSRLLGDGASDVLIGAIREAVSDNHGVQLSGIALVPTGALPRTTSGKPRRYLCREAWKQGTLTPIARWEDGSDGVRSRLVAPAGISATDGVRSRPAKRAFRRDLTPFQPPARAEH